jgi:FdhD protein
MMADGSVRRQARRLTSVGGETLDETIAEEAAIALVYNGVSHAVMMASPCDLEDFARGFSLTERIVERPSEIYDIETELVGRGIEVRLEIAAQRMAGLQERRRSLAGRTGCGLCGVDSLDAALRTVARVEAAVPVAREAIGRAMTALPSEQRINRLNGATHAAGWASSDGSLAAVPTKWCRRPLPSAQVRSRRFPRRRRLLSKPLSKRASLWSPSCVTAG